MSNYLSTELTATCAALGYYDGNKYHLDKHCLGETTYYLLLICIFLYIKQLYMV